MTHSAPRTHGLDTLRSVAILSVIFFHVNIFRHDASIPALLAPAAQLGWVGVDLFFVLSGYLIGTQILRPYLVGECPGLWAFYRKRLFRVLPAYAAVLLLYCFVPIWSEDPGHLPPLWQLVTFTQNLFVDYRVDHAFSHVWSLCVEEHFYLLLPLIVLAMMRKPSVRKTTALLATLVLFGICLRAFFLFHLLKPLANAGQPFGLAYIERIYYPTYSRLDGLLAGVALALVKTFRPAWWSMLARRGNALCCLGIALVGTALYLFKDRWESVSGASALGVVLGFPLLAAGLGLLVASALCENGLLRFKVPGAKLIATLAYSLYLTHKEVIHLVDLCFHVSLRTGVLQWLELYACSCLVVAAALYLCVERPFLILRDKRKTSKQATHGPSFSDGLEQKARSSMKL